MAKLSYHNEVGLQDVNSTAKVEGPAHTCPIIENIHNGNIELKDIFRYARMRSGKAKRRSATLKSMLRQ